MLPQSAGQGNPYVFGAPKCMIGTQGITTDTLARAGAELSAMVMRYWRSSYYLEDGLQLSRRSMTCRL